MEGLLGGDAGQWDGRATAARHSGRPAAPAGAGSSFANLGLGHEPGSGLVFGPDRPEPEVGGVEVWALPVEGLEVAQTLLG